MNSVRKHERLGETICRHLRLALFVLGLWAVRTQVVGLGWLTPIPDGTIDECHNEYLQACASASLAFSDAFDLCEQQANETELELSIDVAVERLQIELGASDVCGNLHICDTLENDLEYFKCISDNGSRNLEILAEITYNSTSAQTRLRQDYDAVYRTYLLCTLDAQKSYMEDLRQAYRELSHCRIEANDYVD
ncbi:uncharacterized protein LOC117581597 [Drosophila guanche]|uniref:Protein TsetseEP domain-containing protein n=1 Tax=Drosophila guanche TaxID=7266 RepID=A0A3B0JE94_DROGU|nr:uncharacterized protein LOC117581597 [Drosophila guanche]SPP73590.1 Hypothetical predicted protein [Drosophila guanche]